MYVRRVLWRYVDFGWWDRLVADPRLPLTRLAAFEDAFECSVVGWLHRALPGGHDLATDQLFADAAATQRLNFASCWFADDDESIAMWDLYVHRGPRLRVTADLLGHVVGYQPGVAIAVERDDLQHLAPSGAILDDVRYVRPPIPLGTSFPWDSPRQWPFYKFWGYRHEHEVRLIVERTAPIETTTNGRFGALNGTDLLSLVRCARVFSPRAREEDDLIARVKREAPHVQIERTHAYPIMQRRYWDDEWWLDGMEPDPSETSWKKRTALAEVVYTDNPHRPDDEGPPSTSAQT